MDVSVQQGDGGRAIDSPVLGVGRFDPLLVGIFAALLSAAGAARPSLWYDEAATITAGTRTLQQLWGLLGRIDAVHGTYYLVMHGWLAVFPATEFWVRVPSCLFIGVAAAGVVVLGRRFSERTFAVTAGLVFAMLPRITWAAIEARPYAMATACAVWLTVLVVDAARRDRAAWWVGYALALIASTMVNMFVGLVVLPHLVAVALTARRRTAVIRWAIATVIALGALTPFVSFARTQIKQVAWIKPIGMKTLEEVGYEQFFDHSAPFAIGCALLLVAALCLRREAMVALGSRTLLQISAAWIVLPTLALVAYSLAAQPIYYPRYLCHTSAAAAYVIAACVTALFRSRERVTAALVVLALAATPNFVFKQRGPYAKEGMDSSQIADLVTARAAPGDCLVLDNTVTWLPGPVRAVTAARPAAYEKLVDPGRGKKAEDMNWLWDAHVAIWAVADRVKRCTVIWTVTDRDPTLGPHDVGDGLNPGPRMGRAPAYQIPQRLGFRIVERWQFNFAQVTKSVR